MTAEHIQCEQGTPGWYEARLGIPTASEFATVMANGKGGKESVTRRKYMLTLIGERITGKYVEGYTSPHMERGKEMEAEAINMYAFMKDVDPVAVGFIRNGSMGASPDRLIDANGLVECKTALPHIQLERLLADCLPPEHKAQVQGELLVSEREWVDFISYWPGLHLFVKRVYRDEPYLVELQLAIVRFLDEMNELQEKLGKYRS